MLSFYVSFLWSLWRCHIQALFENIPSFFTLLSLVLQGFELLSNLFYSFWRISYFSTSAFLFLNFIKQFFYLSHFPLRKISIWCCSDFWKLCWEIMVKLYFIFNFLYSVFITKDWVDSLICVHSQKLVFRHCSTKTLLFLILFKVQS